MKRKIEVNEEFKCKHIAYNSKLIYKKGKKYKITGRQHRKDDNGEDEYSYDIKGENNQSLTISDGVEFDYFFDYPSYIRRKKLEKLNILNKNIRK